MPNFILGRLSQEHGILTPADEADSAELGGLRIGQIIRILPQHACVIEHL